MDDLGNLIIDREKYYSNIGVDMELINLNGNPVNQSYIISDIISTFNSGKYLI